MSSPDLDEMIRPIVSRFLDRYLETSSDIEQLRSDIGIDRWADGVTNDPAVWFEWVQACWEAQGAVFARPVEPGENKFTLSGTYAFSLLVPNDGSDPVVEPARERPARGAERAGIEAFRAVLQEWPGSLEGLKDSIPSP
jgi:hypothetical protein